MATVLLHEAATVTRELPELVRTEAELTRKAVDDRLASIEEKANSQLTDIRREASLKIDQLSNKTDNRLASIQTDLVGQVELVVQNATSNASMVAQDASTLLRTYNAVPGRVEAKIEPFTNCEENDYCWQNLTTDSLVAIRSTSRDVSRAANTINTTVPEIANDVKLSSNAFATQFPVFIDNTTQVAENINRVTKPKWYDRIIGYALNGSILWFNVNRATLPKN